MTVRTIRSSLDLPATSATSSRLTIGSTTWSSIDSSGDVDWHGVTLRGGVQYTISLRSGLQNGISDTVLFGVFTGAAGNALPGTYNDDFGSSLFSRIVFTPEQDGTYYIAAGAFGNLIGSYGITVNSTPVRPDIAGDASTTASIAVSGRVLGEIESAGDVDWYRVNLSTGTYTVNLRQTATDGLKDPFFRGVFDSNSTLLPNTPNDDAVGGYDSQSIFRITTAGTYYLAAGGFGAETGNYQLSIDRIQTVTDAVGDTMQTAGNITVSIPLTGRIDSARDVDWYGIDLMQGERYRFEMRGLQSSAGTLSDTVLVGLRRPDGTMIAGTGNDDFGGSYESSFDYTATASGRHYLVAAGYNDLSGTYRLTVRTTTPSNDVPADVSTTATVNRATPYAGIIDSPGDVDWVRLAVTAGTTYIVREYGARTGTAPALTAPDLLGVYTSSGEALQTTARNFTTGDGFSFVAPTTGTVFLAAGAANDATGGYRVAISTAADTVAPRLISMLPVDGATNVDVSSNITLQFSENVRRGASGTFTLTPDNGTPIVISTTDTTQAVFSGNTVTLNPTADLLPGTHYTLRLSSGAVRDLAGNNNALVNNLDLTTAQPQTSANTDQYTIMVYVDGDNDLEQFAIDDINEMERVALPDNVNLVVMLDRAAGYDASNGNWTNTRYGRITSDSNTSTISSNLTVFDSSSPEMNMGAGSTLTRFIDRAVAEHPADNYGVIVWDHGGGLSGIAWDDASNNDNISLRELREALDASVVNKFSFIGFDACLMAMTEQAFDLKNLADVMIASEELEPGDGWAYDNWLSTLANNPGMTPADIGTAIVNSYGAFYAGQRDITLSAVNLGQLSQLQTALDGFVSAAKGASVGDKAAMAAAISQTPTFPSDGSMALRDLGDWMKELSADVIDTTLKLRANAVANAVDNAVIARTGSVDGATGLSINLPSDGNYSSSYNETEFSFLGQVDWRGVLDLF